MNNLQPNAYVIGRFQQSHINPNKVWVGVKLLIPLDHLSDSVEFEWWIDEAYHPSMKLITIDI